MAGSRSRRDGRERGAAAEGDGRENRRLKLLVAELSLHGEALKGDPKKRRGACRFTFQQVRTKEVREYPQIK